MTTNLKIGIIVGLVAGIVSAIAYEFFCNIALSLGLFEPWWRPLYTGNIITFIPLFGFWGIIFGIIYSKVYDIIPKKGIWKGLIYGLFFFFITVFRIYFYIIPYGLYLNAAGDYFAWFLTSIIFGLIIGILYEFLSSRYYPTKEKKKIITYDMRSGLLPGVIAGVCGGLAASVFAVIGHVTGHWGVLSTGGELVSTIDYWLSQVGTHTLINMIWGTIFGAFFAKVFNLVPGRGIKKGLYFGLIMLLITSFYTSTVGTFRFISHGLWEHALVNFLSNYISAANAIVFGLVLGLLYRKPTEVPAVKKKKILMVEAVNCKHCGASIPKGSRFCKECGKKQ